MDQFGDQRCFLAQYIALPVVLEGVFELPLSLWIDQRVGVFQLGADQAVNNPASVRFQNQSPLCHILVLGCFG